VAISPNPVADRALVKLKNFNPGTYTLYLYDTRGALVMTFPLYDISTTVSMGAMQFGTYFYQVLDESHQVMARGKLVKGGD
jgi:hypothetical protein